MKRVTLEINEQAYSQIINFLHLLSEAQCRIVEEDGHKWMPDENTRRKALEHLAALRIRWDGKPIPDRNALYDEARS